MRKDFEPIVLSFEHQHCWWNYMELWYWLSETCEHAKMGTDQHNFGFIRDLFDFFIYHFRSQGNSTILGQILGGVGSTGDISGFSWLRWLQLLQHGCPQPHIEVIRGFPSMVVAPVSIYPWIFPELNHPTIGIPPWKPRYVKEVPACGSQSRSARSDDQGGLPRIEGRPAVVGRERRSQELAVLPLRVENWPSTSARDGLGNSKPSKFDGSSKGISLCAFVTSCQKGVEDSQNIIGSSPGLHKTVRHGSTYFFSNKTLAHSHPFYHILGSSNSQ